MTSLNEDIPPNKLADNQLEKGILKNVQIIEKITKLEGKDVRLTPMIYS